MKGKYDNANGVKQFRINYICSCFARNGISTTPQLSEKLDIILAEIANNPEIFKEKFDINQRFTIICQAIAAYNKVNDYAIKLAQTVFLDAINRTQTPGTEIHLMTIDNDDLSRVTKSYDRLARAHKKRETINSNLLNIIADKNHVVCREVIIGEGDTGTNLWLDKFQNLHSTVKSKLDKHQIPEVIMLSTGHGSWGHDYTLAQPQSTLERTSTNANPFDYMSQTYYERNPYANARHIYQANQISLAKTYAPILNATANRIEVRSKHLVDWEVGECAYRLKIMTPIGPKTIYTDTINICTGLGPPRTKPLEELLDGKQFIRLNQYDEQKKFTPIVDGNQFILTANQEQSQHRNIVIYGGGGTAAACYRKGFFGNDIHTETMRFELKDQKNSVIWVAKNFNKSGTGKLASSAYENANQRNELIFGKLVSIDELDNGKLSLKFQKMNAKDEIFTLVCDQLIFSLGQDDKEMRLVYEEIDTELKFNVDPQGMILNVSTPDKKVLFFGAAAMAARESEYIERTWDWLHKQNIGGDVGPGSMPPSRAQIKRYLALEGIAPKSINANIDSDFFVLEYLIQAGVEATKAQDFVADLLIARKSSTSGASHETLQKLIQKHGLTSKVDLYGHGLIESRKGKPDARKRHHLLSKFSIYSNEDTKVFLSSAQASAENTNIDVEALNQTEIKIKN
ncbi:MAG: hypothetical protein WC627_03210 [Legionella sp.]|jgi:hypothetical protein